MKNKYLFLYTFTAVISIAVFTQFVFFNTAPTDHTLYVGYAANVSGIHELLFKYPHFLYILTLKALAGFSSNIILLKLVSIFLMTLSVLLKIKMSCVILDFLFKKHSAEVSDNEKIFVLLSLVFVAPIMNWWKFPSIYLGQFSPNVWHNPTLIISMPLSLAVIFYIEKREILGLKVSIYGSIMLFLSALAKPSFALVILPCIFLMGICKRFPLKDTAVYIFPVVIVMLWLFYATYQLDKDSGIIFEPMGVWRLYSEYPLFSLLVSFAFPVSVTLFFRKKFKNTNMVLLAWLLALISVGQFALFAESGSRYTHANFLWASIPSMYILFLIIFSELILIKPGNNFFNRIKYITCYLLLSLHVVSGILFYIRSLLGYNFMA